MTDASREAVKREARKEALREAAAIIGVRVGHGGVVQDCQCGMCMARREDHDAILALLDKEPEHEVEELTDLRGEVALLRCMLEGAMETFPAKEGVMRRRLEEIRAKKEAE